MIIYHSGVHRCMGEAVEPIVRGKSTIKIAILSSYEWFRTSNKERPDRGLRLILAASRRKK